MLEFVWSMNSDLKSVTFKGFFAPFWLVPEFATKSFVVDLFFLRFADFKSLRSNRTISSSWAGRGTSGPLLAVHGLRLLEGAFLRERRCFGAAGAFGFFMVVVHDDFVVNASLYSLGEFLDANGGAGGAAGTSRCRLLWSRST